VSRLDERPFLKATKAEIVATKLFNACRSLNDFTYGKFKPVRLLARRNEDGNLMGVHCVPPLANSTLLAPTASHRMTVAQWCTTKAGTRFLAALERGVV
jgi:hypothetical protein